MVVVRELMDLSAGTQKPAVGQRKSRKERVVCGRHVCNGNGSKFLVPKWISAVFSKKHKEKKWIVEKKFENRFFPQKKKKKN